MFRLQQVRKRPRFFAFIETKFKTRGGRQIKTARKSLQVGKLPCRYRSNTSGIHSSAEVTANRYIGDELPLNGLIKKTVQLFFVFGSRSGFFRLHKVVIPVVDQTVLLVPQRHRQMMS